MNRKLIWLALIAILLCPAAAAEIELPSLRAINATNWGKYFNELMVEPDPSRGEVFLLPADAHLLYQVLPKGVPLTVKSYRPTAGDPSFQPENIPLLARQVSTPDDLARCRQILINASAEAVIYPGLKRLFLLVDGVPYAQVAVAAGLEEPFLPPGENFLARPAPAGNYRLSEKSDHYLSGTYYDRSVIPFGAWLRPIKGIWSYEKGGYWFRVPAAVADDLQAVPARRRFRYYDANLDNDGRLLAARWGNNEFGRYALFWTARGGLGYPYCAYAPDNAVYDQVMLTKCLVQLLTAPGSDDLGDRLAANTDLRRWQALAGYLAAGGTVLSSAEEEGVRLLSENILPRESEARQRALGQYYQAERKTLAYRRRVKWLEKVSREWQFLRQLREQLRADFDRLGIYALQNRENILENWLTERLECRLVSPPTGAKYLLPPTFNAFFRPQTKPSLFDVRERAVMKELIRRAVSGEVGGLALRSVVALNSYNFGRILNDILGDLYKSHGCIHVSPRNSYFLYELIPPGAALVVHPYSAVISAETLAAVPPFADLINHQDDLERLKPEFADPKAVRLDVYPSSGSWLISLKGKPLSTIFVKGGGQKVMRMMQGRDDKGRPIFEKALAYPTSPGRFRILKRTRDYVSKLYYDQTIVPQGGEIVRQGDGWQFTDAAGKRRPLPKPLAADLNSPEEAREYRFFDPRTNASGEVVSIRWGSHPFGTYALQSTKDGKTPWPELIHSSGDLIMEERQLIDDLILIMSAPYDELDHCLENSGDFQTYKTCYELASGTGSGESLGDLVRGSYKLHYGKPLTAGEEATLDPDMIAACRYDRGEKLTTSEEAALITAGVAVRKQGKLKVDRPKLAGLVYDNYQFAVAIEKYAHHYATVRRYWPELAQLRQALLLDFNDLVIKDPLIFQSFIRELMLARTRLEQLTPDQALRELARLTD
ncbi:MAG: L,D-transpeptidase [Candidatus Margulisbacteria bacterium]|jgi:hypothetical protein|nr:L,D-transpeptidase [Candidatus Margulisiibacteriota bacterium]